MANPIFQRFTNRTVPQNNSFQSLANLAQQFNQFKSNFQGDPKERVQALLDSGQMTQEQFRQLSEMANNFKSILNSK